MTQDRIIVHQGGTSFVGADAVRLYQATALKAHIALYLRCGMMPTRGVTITKMLAMATTFSGKSYKRGEGQKAVDDLQTWINAMKAAIPVTTGEKNHG